MATQFNRHLADRHNVNRHNRPVFDHLHPLVYAAVAGFGLWYVVSAWIFFGAEGYAGMLLAVVTGFFLIAMAIPATIWLVWRKFRAPDAGLTENLSLRDWASGELEISQDRRKAADAAIEVILPIAAVALGFMAMGIVFEVIAATTVHS